ncbi:MAG: 1-acyl-sn-glycerol-3-phosphate acyltransferase [Actinomycetota bacterium]
MERHRDELARTVARIAGEVAGRPVDGPDTVLDLDSLGQAELALALEDVLDVRLPDDTPLRTPHEAALAVSAAMGTPRSSPPALRPGIGHLQWLSEAALRPVLDRAYRFRVRGRDRVPREGPVVLASNHDSLLDIPFLAMAAPRRVWFMAKHELYRRPFSSWFFHALGGFPVRRGQADLAAVRAALAVIDAGMALGMFPEDTRSHDFLPFLPGAAWMALVTGAPLVPVAVRGTAEAMPRGSATPRRSRVTVAFGRPMALGRERDPRRRLERARKATETLRAEVESLLRS